jgi:hypothetical protein
MFLRFYQYGTTLAYIPNEHLKLSMGNAIPKKPLPRNE